jgi:hypothetical protein
MAESGDIRASRVRLKLGPAGISLDESGRIRFADAEVLQALVDAGPETIGVDADGPNWSQCSCTNTNQCTHVEDEILR